MSSRIQIVRVAGFRPAIAIVLLPGLLVLSGCGESRVEVFPASGKVTFDGKPPIGAQIVLHPVQRAEESNVAPTGRVKNDGTFTISTYQQGDGAPPGEYIATIQWFRVDPKDGTPGPNVIPADYASAKTSPIKVTVNSAPTVLEPIVLQNKAGAAKKPGSTAARPVAAARR